MVVSNKPTGRARNPPEKKEFPNAKRKSFCFILIPMGGGGMGHTIKVRFK